MVFTGIDNRLFMPKHRNRSIEELKMRYESSSVMETSSKMTTKSKSPKKLMKSKVKQMAAMFNSKISQIIKRDVNVGKYNILVNEFSPEARPQRTSLSQKPVPMPRMSLLNKPKTPIPIKRKKPFATIKKKSSACFAPEDVFGKLSVKEKALLYTQFVEEMTRKNLHLMETSNNFTSCGNANVEKRINVKDLLKELERNSGFPKTTSTAEYALTRMDSMKRACAVRKNFHASNESKTQEVVYILGNGATITQQKVKSFKHYEQPSAEAQSFAANDQTNDSIFQSPHIENLFFSWFKEKHESLSDAKNISTQTDINEESQKSKIDRLLEEAFAKLQLIETEQNSEIPKSMPRKKKTINLSDNSSQTSSAKPSEAEESESGVSSLPKNTSEESQPDIQENIADDMENDLESTKPLKPLRKRKSRKNLVGKRDVSQKEGNQITTTDTESDDRQDINKMKNKSYDKLFIINDKQGDIPAQPESQSCPEINQSLLNSLNSPRKIKSAYTLTINDLETPFLTPRSSVSFVKHPQQSKIVPTAPESYSYTDNLTDQGFQTAINDAASPYEKRSKQNDSEYKLPLTTSLNCSSGIFGYSTPIQSEEQHSFAAMSSAKRLFSPITKPIKNRRKSIYDIESARNSLVTQVIKEDQPFEPQETYKSKIYSQSEQEFFANAPTIDNSEENTNFLADKLSQFWIKCGDFFVALDIDYIETMRLRLLYEIFSKTSCDAKDLHFGIDDNKFTVHGPLNMFNVSSRATTSKKSSHYWFSTGHLSIPFNGKYLTTQKIQRLFRVIKETVEETGILRFGIDDVEFSNVSEFWYQQPKFSVESRYSMLVGLHSGESNGLEGRSKYAWPHSKSVMITDLDQSVNEANSCGGNERNKLSFPPFSANHCDLAALGNEELCMPRNSLAMMNPDFYFDDYENEPLHRLFDTSFARKHQKELKQSHVMSIPEMIRTVKNERRRLSAAQEQFSNYVKPSVIVKDSLDNYKKGTPEYVEKLKTIVSNISKIGCSNNFKECSAEQLDSYMYFLSRYAEICLNSCGRHMEAVLSALTDNNEVMV